MIEQTFDFSSNKREKGMKVSQALTFGTIAILGSVGSTAAIAEEQLDFSPGFYVSATAGETKIDFSSSLKLGVTAMRSVSGMT